MDRAAALRSRSGSWRLWLCGAVSLGGGLPLAQADDVPIPTPVATEPLKREQPREFLDSLSDTAITNDTTQIYRQNGKRREVDLGRGLIAVLDEREAMTLSSASGMPGSAGQSGHVIGLNWQHPAGSAGLWYERGDIDQLWRLEGSLPLDQTWALAASWRDLHSSFNDWPGVLPTNLHRQEHWGGLRWQPPGSGWSSEFGLRRSRLSPEPASTLAPAGATTQALWRTRWQSRDWPGLDLSAQLSRPIGERSQVADLDGPRLAFGASQQFGSASVWPGARLVWQEALQASLLTEDEALTRNAAWRRSLGLELPYGSAQGPGVAGFGTGGALYSQWREHSLADFDDRLWVLGWRQGWRMPTHWSLDTRVEQAVPLAGTSPQRSLQLSERLAYSDSPQRSVSTDVTLIRADTNDSAYLAVKQTELLSADWLGDVRTSIGRKQPHGQTNAGVNETSFAAAAGWREPSQHQLYILGRYTLSQRRVDSGYRDPTVRDRQAHIVLAHLGLLANARSNYSLRVARRLDHDESLAVPLPRRTDMLLARASVDGADRLSLSGHVAWRRDSIDGLMPGYGAELGWRLSRLVVLAFGYNPRGFADNELTLDELPHRGWTLRLRFTIEGALDRWLDAGRRTSVGPVQLPADPVLP